MALNMMFYKRERLIFMKVLHVSNDYFYFSGVYPSLQNALRLNNVDARFFVPAGYTDSVPNDDLYVYVRKCYSKTDRFFYLHKQKKIYRELTDIIKDRIMEVSNTMSDDALRVLGAAYKKLGSPHAAIDALEQDLIFIGLVGMIDPPRLEVKDSIELCKKSGIKTIMIQVTIKTLPML
jgi:hypothetical protein